MISAPAKPIPEAANEAKVRLPRPVSTPVTIGPLDTAPPVNLVEYLSPNSSLELYVSTEWILIPSLIILAVVVGFLPALAAYRTDVAEALTANP